MRLQADVAHSVSAVPRPSDHGPRNARGDPAPLRRNHRGADAPLPAATAALGGRMILVDLAGADSDDRGVEKAGAAELKESRMINKSLLGTKF